MSEPSPDTLLDASRRPLRFFGLKLATGEPVRRVEAHGFRIAHAGALVVLLPRGRTAAWARGQWMWIEEI